MRTLVVGSLRCICLLLCLASTLALSCKPMEEEEDNCLKMCQWLADCALCLTDPQKKCRPLEDCHTYCQSKPSLQSAARCILNLPACDKAAVNICLAGGSKKDGGGAKQDGGNKDAGGGKKDSGAGLYSPHFGCYLATTKLNATKLTVNDDGTSSTSTYSGDYGSGEFRSNGSPITFLGVLKDGQFKGTIQGYSGYKGTLELSFDHAKDLIKSFKQDYWLSETYNGKEVWYGNIVVSGGAMPTTTKVDPSTGHINIDAAVPTGTARCKYISELRDELTDPHDQKSWKTHRITKWSCTSNSYIRFKCTGAPK